MKNLLGLSVYAIIKIQVDGQTTERKHIHNTKAFRIWWVFKYFIEALHITDAILHLWMLPQNIIE